MNERDDRPYAHATPEPDLAPPVRVPGAFDLAFLTGLPDVTEVYLVRHAQQDIDPRGPVGEMVDPPLSPLGRHQAQAVARALAGLGLAAVYSSPLRRARETAAAIAAACGLEPVLVPDLREVEIWRDMPQDKSVREFLGDNYLAALRERMINEKSWDVYPFSEPSAVFKRRAVNAVEAIIAAHPGRRIAVVCHGGVINAYLGHLIATPIRHVFPPGARLHLVGRRRPGPPRGALPERRPPSARRRAGDLLTRRSARITGR
jgi:probable phosphoglycerate mutase